MDCLLAQIIQEEVKRNIQLNQDVMIEELCKGFSEDAKLDYDMAKLSTNAIAFSMKMSVVLTLKILSECKIISFDKDELRRVCFQKDFTKMWSDALKK